MVTRMEPQALKITSRPIRDGDDVDWVTQRLRCSKKGVFNALRERVKLDVQRANEAHNGEGNLLDLNDQGETFFAVYRELHYGQSAVATFSLFGDGRIEANTQVINKALPPFEVHHEWDDTTVTCRLTVDGQDLQLWQISQRALEPLMVQREWA